LGKGNIVGFNVMHTNFGAVGPTLKILREVWKEGAVGVYPDHGKFVMPDWVFEEVDIESSVAYVEEWMTNYKISLVGGCCGLGPDYITALAAHRRGKEVFGKE
jgi:methionine synthase I (cobalamin-dependent)